MNREQAKKLLPIIQAFVDGADVQFLSVTGSWNDAPDPYFCAYDKYRIKPKPLECWIVHRTYSDGSTDLGFGYTEREDAELASGARSMPSRVVHMREVDQ